MYSLLNIMYCALMQEQHDGTIVRIVINHSLQITVCFNTGIANNNSGLFIGVPHISIKDNSPRFCFCTFESSVCRLFVKLNTVACINTIVLHPAMMGKK